MKGYEGFLVECWKIVEDTSSSRVRGDPAIDGNDRQSRC